MPVFAYPVYTDSKCNSLKLSPPIQHTCFAQMPAFPARQMCCYGLVGDLDPLAGSGYILYVKARDYEVCKLWCDAVNNDQLKRRYSFVLKAHESVKGLEGSWWSIQWPVGTLWDECYAVTKLIFKHITYSGGERAALVIHLLEKGMSADEAMIYACIREPNGYAFPCGGATTVAAVRDYLDNGPWFSRDPGNGWNKDLHLGDALVKIGYTWGSTYNFNIGAKHRAFNLDLNKHYDLSKGQIKDHTHFLELIKPKG